MQITSPICPRCGSVEVSRHHIANVPFDDVAGGALAARRAGRNAHAVSVFGVWVAIEAFNRLFRPHHWRCDHCAYEFERGV